jgi:hypothetical protein
LLARLLVGLSLGWKCQPENGGPALTRDVYSADICRIGEVQRLAVFTAIDFGVVTPGATHVTTLLFDDVVDVEPTLEMSAAKLVLGVLFITGALPRFLHLDLVIGELLGSLHFASHPSRRQNTCLASRSFVRSGSGMRILPHRIADGVETGRRTARLGSLEANRAVLGNKKAPFPKRGFERSKLMNRLGNLVKSRLLERQLALVLGVLIIRMFLQTKP